MRRCMALLAASARALLQDLLRWQAPKHADVARQCAQHLSHLFEDIAERKVMKTFCNCLERLYCIVIISIAPIKRYFQTQSSCRHALVFLAFSCTHVT